MKTNETTVASSSVDSTTKKTAGFALDISLPKSWAELSDEQVHYAYKLLAANVPAERVVFYCFIHFSGLQIFKRENQIVFLRQGTKIFPVLDEDLLLAAQSLDFLGEQPDVPIRLAEFDGHDAVPADFRGVPFGTYLEVQNYFQGYLQTQNTQCIAQLARLLYDGLQVRQPSDLLIYNMVSWLAALNKYFASEFPDLFRPVTAKGEEDDWPDMKAITEAEIRALNGGDITKTQAVLECDTWGALAELNAKAREAKELEEINK